MDWNDLAVEDKNADMTWRLPRVAPMSSLLYRRFDGVIGNSHNCRLATGSDNIYQSPKLVRDENKTNKLLDRLSQGQEHIDEIPFDGPVSA